MQSLNINKNNFELYLRNGVRLIKDHVLLNFLRRFVVFAAM